MKMHNHGHCRAEIIERVFMSSPYLHRDYPNTESIKCHEILFWTENPRAKKDWTMVQWKSEAFPSIISVHSALVKMHNHGHWRSSDNWVSVHQCPACVFTTGITRTLDPWKCYEIFFWTEKPGEKNAEPYYWWSEFSLYDISILYKWQMHNHGHWRAEIIEGSVQLCPACVCLMISWTMNPWNVMRYFLLRDWNPMKKKRLNNPLTIWAFPLW